MTIVIYNDDDVVNVVHHLHVILTIFFLIVIALTK